jgi:small-conductance mechanosensitive channel
VDLHEKRQLDLAEHVAKVNEQVAKAKAHARPWRAIIATVLAVIAGVVASQAGQNFKDWTGHGHYVYKIVAAACIAAFFIFGAIAVLGLAGKTRDVLTPAVGSSHAAVVRYAILLIGGVTVLCLGVSLMKVPIGQLLVGGAVTTILLGIAGQQSLANIFAGLVLLLSRPFMVGDYIRLKSGALGGITDGLVAEIGITYLRLDTEDGTLHLPNSQVLAAAVGPIAPPRPRESGPVESGPVPETPVPALGPAKPDALGPAKPDHDDPPYGTPPYGSP